MDMIGSVGGHKMKTRREGSKRRSPSGKNGLKVVYISSPMRVKTSASEFRAIVQELTGRDSDVARFMETSTEADHSLVTETTSSLLNDIAHHEEKQYDQSSCTAHYGFGNNFLGEYNNYAFENESPTESDSLVERFDEKLFSMPHIERSFRESNFPFAFQESVLLDVFN